MSVADIGPKPFPVPHPPWAPALTEREAVLLGYDRQEYRQAIQFARMVVDYHFRAGTQPDAWEPTRLHNEQIADPFVLDAQEELAERLAEDTDPLLDQAQSDLEEARERLDELTSRRGPLLTPESGVAYPVVEAVRVVAEHDARIERHEQRGMAHHRRVARWLKAIAPWMPWGELVGYLFFVSYFLDVPLFEPWVDLGAWSLAMVVVVATILGQRWLVYHAATSHNHGREAIAEGNGQEADDAMRRRNLYLAAAAITATSSITAGMVLRGVITLGMVGWDVTAFMVAVAVSAGVLMPTLAYLATALDGSKVSRERDSLIDDLNDDLDDHVAILEECHRGLAAVEQTGQTLVRRTFPAVCNDVQDVVDGAHRRHGLVRLLIGTVDAEPPEHDRPTVTIGTDGEARGWIATGLPGAARIDLRPLSERGSLLRHLLEDAARLRADVEAHSEHPWGRRRP